MLIHEGWKVRKDPVAGEVFFLTFSFIELRRTCQVRLRFVRSVDLTVSLLTA